MGEFLALLKLLQALSTLPPAPQPPAQPTLPPTIEAPASLGDAAEAILHCYHHSGRYDRAEVIRSPWERQAEWSADSSVVVQIYWNGALLKTAYHLQVAIMLRGKQLRARILADDAKIGASSRCKLDQWVEVSAPK
jgi:hypothetical protein